MLENNVSGIRSVTYNDNTKFPDPPKIGISEQNRALMAAILNDFGKEKVFKNHLVLYF